MRRLRMGEEKERKKKPQDENIIACPIPYTAVIMTGQLPRSRALNIR